MQCDQMLHSKVAQFFPKVVQKVGIAVFSEEWGFSK